MQQVGFVLHDAIGRRYVLRQGATTLGRGPGHGICLDDPSVSRPHARLIVSADKVEVIDHGSANGTFVNGERISNARTVGQGNEITVGRHRFTVSREAQPLKQRTSARAIALGATAVVGLVALMAGVMALVPAGTQQALSASDTAEHAAIIADGQQIDTLAGEGAAPDLQLMSQSSGDCARFLGDVNYPDGSGVHTGQSIDKAWRLQNCGSGWSGVHAVRLGGNYGPASFNVPQAGANQTVDVHASITAPNATGHQRATYQLRGPHGNFGPIFWVELEVTPTSAAKQPESQPQQPQRGTPARASANPVVHGGTWLNGQGIDVCYPVGSYCPGVTIAPGEPTSDWQCVELAARLYDTKGWVSRHLLVDHAGAMTATWAKSYGLDFHTNGSGYVPVPGDLIILSGNPGHVSVVARAVQTSSGRVHTVEENDSPTGLADYSITGTRIWRPGDGRPVLGVIHAPANTSKNTSDTDGSGVANTGFPASVTASSGVRERSGPGTEYAIAGFLSYKTHVTIVCQERGLTSVGGSNVWDKLSDGHWVTDYWLNTPNFNAFTSGIRQCQQGTSGLDGGPHSS